MSIYEKLDKDDVLFCDRTGNIITVYCKDNVRVVFEYPSIERAIKKYTQFRKDLENIRIDDDG